MHDEEGAGKAIYLELVDGLGTASPRAKRLSTPTSGRLSLRC
jgi:hypothetical protein